jgi:predicted transcriptional regulator of viral defense system
LTNPTFYKQCRAMSATADRQQDHALALIRQEGMLRLSEFLKAGIAATTVSRMEQKGFIVRLGRGLYQRADADLDVNQSLAMAAKFVPDGVVCLVSALAFHELTDSMPPRVWMAIGFKSRRPAIDDPKLEIVRFQLGALTSGVERHLIAGVSVPISSAAKNIVDLFRYRQQAGLRYRHSPGLAVAIEGLREALRRRRATPADIARYAQEAGIWHVVEPYLQALTANA